MSQSAKKFDYVVFIGRFQPFHLAHQQTVEIAWHYSDNVILVVGSAQEQRSIKNPFSFLERQAMIKNSFVLKEQQALHFVPIIDWNDDHKWKNALQQGVGQIATNHSKIALIGHFKDASSYYLNLFPEWTLIKLDNLQNALSATPLREKYYQGQIQVDKFPLAVQHFLAEFQQTPHYQALKAKFFNHDESYLD